VASRSELRDASHAIAWMTGSSITDGGGEFTPLQLKIRSSALHAGRNDEGSGFRGTRQFLGVIGSWCIGTNAGATIKSLTAEPNDLEEGNLLSYELWGNPSRKLQSPLSIMRPLC
jgi:hypothetical protein